MGATRHIHPAESRLDRRAPDRDEILAPRPTSLGKSSIGGTCLASPDGSFVRRWPAYTRRGTAVDHRQLDVALIDGIDSRSTLDFSIRRLASSHRAATYFSLNPNDERTDESSANINAHV